MRQRLEFIIDWRELPLERTVDRSLLRMEVARSLRLLTQRERIVLQLRYGLAPHWISGNSTFVASVFSRLDARAGGVYFP